MTRIVHNTIECSRTTMLVYSNLEQCAEYRESVTDESRETVDCWISSRANREHAVRSSSSINAHTSRWRPLRVCKRIQTFRYNSIFKKWFNDTLWFLLLKVICSVFVAFYCLYVYVRAIICRKSGSPAKPGSRPNLGPRFGVLAYLSLERRILIIFIIYLYKMIYINTYVV